MLRNGSRARKWALHSISAVVLLSAGSNTWPGSELEEADTAFIGLRGTSCDFSFLVRKGQWIPDDVTGSTALLRKRRPADPPIYLNGARTWKPPIEGHWDTVVRRRCKLEDRGSFMTNLHVPVHVFLASDCMKAGGSWYADHAPKHFLFGQLPAGVGKDRQADFIWISSDDRAAILALDNEFRQTLWWHNAKPPECSAK